MIKCKGSGKGGGGSKNKMKGQTDTVVREKRLETTKARGRHLRAR